MKKTTLLAIAIPTIYAIILRLLFGIKDWEEIFSVMSVTFLFLLPSILGAICILLLPEEKAKNVGYQILLPWVVVLFFFIITLILAIEGWACWLMIAPIFMIASSIGGVIGGIIRKNKSKNRLNSSLLALIPFAIAPLENLIETVPGTYQAYTYVDIDAPAELIWDNVTRVSEIPEDQDKGYLTRALGFPRPIKAELDFEGVGAYREAIFTGGLVFHETVTEYQDNKKMVFDIKAYPYEIPSTTLDEHIVIGGEYFDVLTGTYELQKLKNGKHRLHLYSYFKMKTTFNFYAGWWGKWIMKDIQNNILQVEKKRSEGKA